MIRNFLILYLIIGLSTIPITFVQFLLILKPIKKLSIKSKKVLPICASIFFGLIWPYLIVRFWKYGLIYHNRDQLYLRMAAQELYVKCHKAGMETRGKDYSLEVVYEDGAPFVYPSDNYTKGLMNKLGIEKIEVTV